MFNPVINLGQSYYNHLPKDTLKTVGKSAAFTFSLTFFLRSGMKLDSNNAIISINLLRPLAMAGIAALASLIHALMTPLFDGMFGDRKINLYRETMKWIVISACTTVIANKLLTTKTEFVALQLFLPLPINFFKSIYNTIANTIELFDPQAGTNLRNDFLSWGFAAEEGSNSIYIMPMANLNF
jgi:hypothetical protein